MNPENSEQFLIIAKKLNHKNLDNATNETFLPFYMKC